MNRHILANIVDQKMQSCIDAGYRTGRVVSIHLGRPEHCFIFDWEIDDDEYLTYDYRNANVIDLYSEKQYPNVCHFLCTELDSLFTNINRQNKFNYLDGLTDKERREFLCDA